LLLSRGRPQGDVPARPASTSTRPKCLFTDGLAPSPITGASLTRKRAPDDAGLH